MTADQDLDVLLETVLARAVEPLSLTAVLKALPAGKKPAQQTVKAHLDELATAGRIHRWRGKTMKFWGVSQKRFVRDQVLQALAMGPLVQSEINRRARKSPQALVKAVLAELVGDKTVRKHPRLGKRQPFGIGPPDAVDYLSVGIGTMFKQLNKKGFESSELHAALRRYVDGIEACPGLAGNGAEEILAAIPRLNSQASRGALVYLTDLRAALTQQLQDKDAFDRAVLELARQGKVQLQSHPWPGRLSDSDKHALVPNGRGGFFDTIGLRLE
jgi:hypothetical protein